MLQDLDKRVEGLDVNKSAFMSTFSFMTMEGETYLSPSPVSFVENFNKAFGDMLSIKGTQMAGGVSCILSFLDETTATKTPDKEVITEEDTTPEETTPESSLNEVLHTNIDLEYASTLSQGKSKKASKEALELYARKFGIELNRTKSFDNMLKSLQEQI
jgi:hypothetical protein